MQGSVLNGALIGCGFFALNHMHAWAAAGGAKIIAVCDRDRGRAEAMARRFGVPAAYEDADTMLSECRLDFVDIVTTSPSHRPLVELACAYRTAVICQKPLADTMEDARAMVAAAKAAGVQLLVHENFRWQRGFVRMGEIVDQGMIGKLHFARFSFRHGYDNYGNQPYLAELERFALMDVGLHLFDLARRFMGEVRQITCHTQRLNPKVRGEDAFTTLLAHENGAVSICDCSFETCRSPDPFPNMSAEIEGGSGTLVLTAGTSLTLHRRDGVEVLPVEPEVAPWGERPWHVVQDSVVAFIAQAVQALRNERPGAPSGADNLKTLALALAAYESAERGSTISMADLRETADA